MTTVNKALVEEIRLLRESITDTLHWNEPIEFDVGMSVSQPWSISYSNRRHVYVWSPTPLNLSVEDYGTINLPSFVWYQMDLPEGLKVYALNVISSLVYIKVKCTNELITRTDPTIIQNQLEMFSRSGQMFSIGTGVLNTTTLGISMFNPSTSLKTVIFTRVYMASSNNDAQDLTWLLTDQNYANPLAPVNLHLGSQVKSVMNCTYNLSVAEIGTRFLSTRSASSASGSEMLYNNTTVVVPPGNGLGLYDTTGAGLSNITLTWIEV